MQTHTMYLKSQFDSLQMFLQKEEVVHFFICTVLPNNTIHILNKQTKKKYRHSADAKDKAWFSFCPGHREVMELFHRRYFKSRSPIHRTVHSPLVKVICTWANSPVFVIVYRVCMGWCSHLTKMRISKYNPCFCSPEMQLLCSTARKSRGPYYCS